MTAPSFRARKTSSIQRLFLKRDCFAAFARTSLRQILDLCGGTGVALNGRRSGAEQAYSGTFRTARRACGFNRQLNDVSNAQALRAICIRFETASLTRFQRTSYVPTLQPRWVFFSGGRDGEKYKAHREGLPIILMTGECSCAHHGHRSRRPTVRTPLREWIWSG